MSPRAERLQRKLDIPLLIAALLVVPILLVEEADPGAPWEQVAAILNWLTWLAFVGELVTMLVLVDDRRRYLAEHPVDVVIVLLTPPFLTALFESLRALRLLRLLRVARFARRAFSTSGLTYAALLALLTILSGGQAFASLEDHPLGDGIYWAITTMTTVGYGDLSPETGSGKALAVAVMFVGIGFVAVLTGAIAERFLAEDLKAEPIEADGDAVRELRAIAERLAALERQLKSTPRR